MRHGMMALVGVVMLSWSGTSLAASLADRAQGFEGSFTSAGVASPGLGLPHASQLHLLPAGAAGAKAKVEPVQMEDSTRAMLAVVLTILVGFGTGHFIIGDGAAWLFLGLDLAIAVGVIGIWVAGYATLLSGGFPAFMVVAIPVLVIAALVVKIWEVVDIIFKSGIAAGPKPEEGEAILPRSGDLARSAFQPAMANGLNLRF